MMDKFRLGLFDNPYVDKERALSQTGQNEFRIKGKIAQQKATVLLKNNALLPLAKGTKIYAEGFNNPDVINNYGELVNDPKEADVIFTAPYDSL